MRSLHRYASDAFVALSVLHLLRELMLGRYKFFRWFTWVSDVPLLWLAIASGIVGYWMVWDMLAQYVATTTTEWLDALPIFAKPIALSSDHSLSITLPVFTSTTARWGCPTYS